MPAMINFGGVQIGNQTADTIEITSTGKNNLTIDLITLSGTDAAEFDIQSDNCSTRAILPSDKCVVQVVFSPASGSPKSAILSVPSNDPESPIVDVALQGLGVDVIPPTGYILIENGADFTNSLIVNLTIGASDETGMSEMCLSNTSSCYSWESYQTTAMWAFPLGDGDKPVYVWFRDVAGNENAIPYSDSIIMDTAKPALSITSPFDSAVLMASTYTINGTASDIGSGVQNVEVSSSGCGHTYQDSWRCNWRRCGQSHGQAACAAAFRPVGRRP
ncbi:MAG: choice-of-anchor D domain-containing protein [Nitrospirae bacterium]|nr:choice-of-anchor D domain-containing protein [Nitrospirota bacterium]